MPQTFGLNAVLFGATGMVGQGVLRECLLDPEVEHISAVGRSAVAQQNPKLRNVVVRDLFSIDARQLRGFNACFFCAGVSVAGLSEAEYTKMTYEATMHVASLLDPQTTFIYVSGAGTDSSERGRTMWARVKGRTENALLHRFPSAYMFRPALIQPMHGIRSKTRAYRIFYAVMWPLMPILRRLLPRYVTTTEQIGRKMLEVAKHGYPKRILEAEDISR